MRQLKELMDLSGRVALITGGAGHLGLAMAESLAELGCNLILVDLNGDKCSRAAKKLKENFHINAVGFEVDLVGKKKIESINDIVEAEFGKLDVLINNAAFVGTAELEGWAVPFEFQNIDTWRKAIEINLTVAFHLTQSSLSLLRRSSSASVINISSIYGVLGPDMSLYEGTEMGNPAAYAASKGGLNQLTRWMAATLAPEIRVNTISPGGIERGQPESFQKKYIARTPMKRMAKEEDFKGIVAFLASDLSAYVTGQNLLVDGGWSVW